MRVTHKTIQSGQKVDKNTTYIVYVPGNAENVGAHSNEGWSWCDKNTIIDLCNHPHHSEWHNPGVLGRSKFRSIAYHIITFTPFITAIAALYLFTPLALAIPASIVLGIAFLVTTLLINNVFVRANAKFYLRGEDSVAVGVKRVLDLLEKGVHPDNIILNGWSIGGGVAAEVYKKFKSEGIHLRCQISTSFSSMEDVLTDMLPGNGEEKSLSRKLARLLLKIGHWDIKTYETIKSITPRTMFSNNKDDRVIGENAQLVTKIREMEKNVEKKSNQTTEDEIFELLFKKHTMLKPNKVFCDAYEKEYEKKYEAGCYNTHNLPLSCLESAKSPDIGAEDLHYLFTYLPYHMDVLRTEVGNWPVEQRDADELVNDILKYVFTDIDTNINIFTDKESGHVSYTYCALYEAKYQFVYDLVGNPLSKLNKDEYKQHVRIKLVEANKNISELRDILISLVPQEEKLRLILGKVLLNSSVEEIEELQTLINELPQDEHCLTKNQDYSKEKFKGKFEKLGEWVGDSILIVYYL